MQSHQQELHFYPSDYETLEVRRNQDRFDLVFTNHDGTGDDATSEIILTSVTWDEIQRVLMDDYGVKVNK